MLAVIDAACLTIFTIELLAKLYVWRLAFFRNGWNVFDFIIVAISLMPAVGALSVLRALRILRVPAAALHPAGEASRRLLPADGAAGNGSIAV